MADPRSFAFLITNSYQIHHFAPIAAELGEVTFVIEHRDQDFGLDADFVLAHVPDARIEHVRHGDLLGLDGRFEVIICQTPVLPQRLLERSLIVAQQYSMAKEAYQYGAWRALTDLNLMYGSYSLERINGFASAVAVGNPLFDGVFEAIEPRTAPKWPARGLYLPTYGDLAGARHVIPHFAGAECSISVKPHHMDRLDLIAPSLPDNCALVGSEVSPAQLLAAHDFVITDYSGAAFDAVISRRPLVVLDRAVSTAGTTLVADELERALLAGSAATWNPGRPDNDLRAAVELASMRLLDDEGYRSFTDTYLANPGHAGRACASAVTRLLERGPAPHFARDRVAERQRELLIGEREAAREARRLRRALGRRRSPAELAIGRAIERTASLVRNMTHKYPPTERAIARTVQRIRDRIS